MLIPNKYINILTRSFRLTLNNANELSTTKNIYNINEKLKSKLFEYMSIYEETIGLKEIKVAQQAVLDAERNFLDAQNERRDLNTSLIETQQRLRDLRDEMDRLTRTDSRYLKLFTEEHSLLQIESKLVDEYKLKESKERDLFFFLSTALRDAQEKERIRVERTKYLQLGLSILCTTLGILSAYLLNYFRSSNIQEILKYDKQQFENIKEILGDLNEENTNKTDSLSHNLITLENDLKNQSELIAKIIENQKTTQEENKLVLTKTFYPIVISYLILLGSIFYLNK